MRDVPRLFICLEIKHRMDRSVPRAVFAFMSGIAECRNHLCICQVTAARRARGWAAQSRPSPCAAARSCAVRRQKPSQIATTLHCAPQTVRNVIHAFDARGLACVQHGSNVPLRVEPVLNAEKREQLRAILHQSPRTFGQPASVWTLKRLAAVCHEQGLSDTTLSCPTMLDAIVRLGVSWQRAKHWIVSPDPAYERKKNAGTA